MGTRLRPFGILAAAVLTGSLAAGLISGCSVLRAPASTVQPSSEDGESDMSLDDTYAAVTASDPRIVRTSSVIASRSGSAHVLTVAVRLDSAEPVSTQTLANIIVAAVDSAPGPVDQLDVIARPESDSGTLLDLSAAAAGLPQGVETSWLDSKLSVWSPDPAVIGAVR